MLAAIGDADGVPAGASALARRQRQRLRFVVHRRARGGVVDARACTARSSAFIVTVGERFGGLDRDRRFAGEAPRLRRSASPRSRSAAAWARSSNHCRCASAGALSSARTKTPKKLPPDASCIYRLTRYLAHQRGGAQCSANVLSAAAVAFGVVARVDRHVAGRSCALALSAAAAARYRPGQRCIPLAPARRCRAAAPTMPRPHCAAQCRGSAASAPPPRGSGDRQNRNSLAGVHRPPAAHRPPRAHSRFALARPRDAAPRAHRPPCARAAPRCARAARA